MLHIIPWTLILMLNIRQLYLLCFWCSTLHSMKSAQHCTILVKVDVLNTCGAMLCSYVRIAFLPFFMKIENEDMSMIEVFHGFMMLYLIFSKIGWILFRNAKETLQKMLARKCSYRGKYMKDWKEVLIKSLKLPNSFVDIRLSMYWQNAFVKILSKTGLTGKNL